MTGWAKFWAMFLSPATARFILALLALAVASYALYGLMNREVVASNRDALLLALGIILGLSKDAYSYYFGSTARGDERALPPKDPLPASGVLDLEGAEIDR